MSTPLQRGMEYLTRGLTGDEPEANRRTTEQPYRTIAGQVNRDIPRQPTEPPGSDEAARIAAKMSPEGREIVEEIDARIAKGGELAGELPAHLPADLLDRAGRLPQADQRRLAKFCGLRVKEQAVQRRRA